MQIGPAFVVSLGITLYILFREDVSTLSVFLIAFMLALVAAMIDKGILQGKYMWRLW